MSPNEVEQLKRRVAKLQRYRRAAKLHIKRLEAKVALHQEIARRSMAERQTLEAIASKVDHGAVRRNYYEQFVCSKRSRWRELWQNFRVKD